MPALGARALIDLAIPTGIDGAKVLQFQLRDGRTAQQVIAEAAAMIGAVNEDIANQYAGLYGMTQDLFARYPQGQSARSETPKRSEFARADAVKTSDVGHMLPIGDYLDAVAWTPLYLRDAYGSQITADLRLIADRWRNRVAKEIWTRALTNTENLIAGSSTGYDVPWAIGTATNVNYIPPQYGNKVFDSTHTHFIVANDSSVDWDTLLENMVIDLRHHGHSGMLTCFVSGDDLSEIAALTKFVPLTPAGIQVVSGNTSAPVYVAPGEFQGLPGELFGYYKSLRGLVALRYEDRLPADYAFMTRSYGPNNPRNGIALREHPANGFGLRVDPQVTNSISPELDFVQFPATHGIGVMDRTNGVAGYIHAAATVWVNPTIS